jgi:histidinol phosphatase-like enzyme
MVRAVYMGRKDTLHAGGNNLAAFAMLPLAVQGLARLGQVGLLLAVVSNEYSIKMMPKVPIILRKVEQVIHRNCRFPIKFKYCLHHPAKKCTCRLPEPELIHQVEEDYHVHLPESFMIASRQWEVDAAQAAGIGHIVTIETGRHDWQGKNGIHRVDTFLDAADYILETM